MKVKIKTDTETKPHVCSDHCKSGMGAMGHTIPSHRLSEALKHMRDICPDIETDHAMQVIGKASKYLEHDEPYKAMEILFPHAEYGHGLEPLEKASPLDLTGAYRIMAVLLAG